MPVRPEATWIVWVTTPDLRTARRLARLALDQRLVACAQLRPGVESHYLWQGRREQQAIDSIRKLKALARETGAQLWPNHDMAFYRGLPTFPRAIE